MSLLGQFDVQRFVTEIDKTKAFGRGSSSTVASRLNTIGKHLKDKSLYALGFCSEFLLSPDDTLLLSYDTYKGDLDKNPRAKAIFNHEAISLLPSFQFLDSVNNISLFGWQCDSLLIWIIPIGC